MKIIFAGTPDFAAVALKHLIDAGHEIALVLSQPDRPSGRGMKLTPSPVKKLALEHGIPVITPVTLSLKKAPEESARIHADLKAVGADFPRLRWFRAPPAWRPRPARRLFLGVGGARGEKPMGETPAHRRRTIRHRTGVSGVAPAGYAAPARPKRGSAPDRAARRVLPRAR